MIKRIVLLNNTDFTIDRPIVKSVVELVKNTILKSENLYTFYLSDKEASNFETEPHIADNKMKEEYLEITVEKITEGEYVYNNTVSDPDTKAILRDKGIGFFVLPNLINTTYNINFRYYSRNRNVLVKILSLLKSSATLDNNILHTDVEYYYTIPVPLLALIENIAELKNIPPKDYLINIAAVPLDFMRSRTDEYSVPVVREQQPSVLTHLVTDPFEIRIDKDDSKGYYIEFQYSIDLEVPYTLFTQYPLLVNNKPIKKDFIPQEQATLVGEKGSYYAEAFAKIKESIYRYLRTGDVIIRIPNFDSFDFKHVPVKPGMIRLLSILLEVDPSDPYYITSIEELKALNMNDFFLKYLKTRVGKSLFTPGMDFVHFEILEDAFVKDMGLYLNENGEIRTSKPLDTLKTYRLLLNVVWDLNMLYNVNGLPEDFISQWREMLDKLNIYGHYEYGNSMFTVMLMRIIALILSPDSR